MLPYIHFIVDIPSYSLMSDLGLCTALVISFFRMKKNCYNERILLVVLLFITIGAFIGSKTLFFFTQLPEVITNFSISKTLKIIITSGFVFYGGLFGAILFAILCAKILAIDSKSLLSFLAPSFAIFHAFGRIGCFMGGCCYGIGWHGGIAMAAMPNIKRFPVQLLEAFGELIIFFILIKLDHLKKFNLMIIYLLLYSILRFFDEFLRDDIIRGIWALGLSTSQWIAIFTISGVLIRLLSNNRTLFLQHSHHDSTVSS